MIANAVRLGIETLARTWSVDVVGDDRVRTLRADRVPVLFAVWHDQLLAPLWHRRHEGITLLVSAHRDGRRLAAAARSWGYETVYGSSTRGGAQGLLGLVRALRTGRDGAVTPDGPVGPARVAKEGVFTAARRADAVIVPVAVATEHAWRAPSWDRFQVPRPFARVRIAYGPALHPAPSGASRRDERDRLGLALLHTRREAECTG
jgi:lysophospholipid acyltransferase (LPLAT)-like uncharacterized protein